MAISSQVSQLSFVGNGSLSTPYALADLRFDDNSWLTVEEIDEDDVITVLALGVDYTISGSGVTSSASIITGGRAIPASSTLLVSRNTPLIQSAALTVNGRVPSATLERVDDWQTMAMIDQRRREEGDISRAIRIPREEAPSDATVLPPPALRKDSIIFFGTDTGAIEILRLDQLAQRLMVILGAEAILPYRTREAAESFTVTQEDVNSSIRINSASPVIVTLPETADFSGEFFCTLSRFGVGTVDFVAPVGVIIESAVGSAPRIFSQMKPVVVQLIGVNRWWVFGDIY